jgi:hypothetical protein
MWFEIFLVILEASFHSADKLIPAGYYFKIFCNVDSVPNFIVCLQFTYSPSVLHSSVTFYFSCCNASIVGLPRLGRSQQNAQWTSWR